MTHILNDMEIEKNKEEMCDKPQEVEEWRDIEGYEGYYQVSNKGRVKSLPRQLWNGKVWFESKEIILSGKEDCEGYPVVSLNKNLKRKHIRVHRLVAQAFIPNPNNYRVVNHIDGSRNNNNVENLEWCTQQYNIRHAVKIGRFDKTMKGIKVLETGKVYPSIHECARDMIEYKVDFRHISDCIRGKLKSHAGFHFALVIKGTAITYEEFEEIKSKFCDFYCKYPYEVCNQEELDEVCHRCPLNNLEEGHDDL